MTIEMKSAIVGYYRSCQSCKRISSMLGIDIRSIYEVVGNYLLNGKH
jgi:hypothetical protein